MTRDHGISIFSQAFFLFVQVIAESLSEEEIGGLKELFKMIDTDNSGTITYDELKDGLKRVGSDLMEPEIQALMDAVSDTIIHQVYCPNKIVLPEHRLIVLTIEIIMLLYQADIDNSGTIDYGEFLAATLHMNKLEREESLVSAFAFFDKDGSGFITIDELSQACQQFGLSDVHLEDMIKDVDQNNVSFLNTFFCIYLCTCLLFNLHLSNYISSFFQDGQIDYSEFAAMMRKGNAGGAGRRTMRNSLHVNLGELLKPSDN